MSGKIKFNIRKGKPTGNNEVYNQLGYYPEWFLTITGECGNKINISPTLINLKDLISEMISYENLQQIMLRGKKKYQIGPGKVSTVIKEGIAIGNDLELLNKYQTTFLEELPVFNNFYNDTKYLRDQQELLI